MKLIVDADSLAGSRLSGVGQTVDQTLRQIVAQTQSRPTCLLPFNHFKGLADKGYDTKQIKQKRTPPGRINNLLAYLQLPLPIDWVYGRGVYWFPNFKHYPISKKSRKIVTVHDLTYLKYPETMTPRNRKLLEKVVPKALKQADRVAAVSHTIKQELVDAYPWAKSEKIIVTTPGIDRNVYYKRENSEVESTKAKFKIKGNYLVFVSSIEPRKNLVNQLEGFAKSSGGMSGKLSLILIGAGGWLNDEIEQTITRLVESGIKIIRPKTWVTNDEVAALLSGSLASLYVSLYEGFGMPVIEAQACGTAVITSNCSSLPEAAGKNGALFVDPKQTQDIADAIDLISSDSQLRNRLVKNGTENQAKYSWDKTAAILIKAANELSRELE